MHRPQTPSLRVRMMINDAIVIACQHESKLTFSAAKPGWKDGSIDPSSSSRQDLAMEHRW
jgi:hypothetical protein